MNENDKPRGERRRSSRRGRRGSGGSGSSERAPQNQAPASASGQEAQSPRPAGQGRGGQAAQGGKGRGQGRSDGRSEKQGRQEKQAQNPGRRGQGRGDGRSAPREGSAQGRSDGRAGQGRSGSQGRAPAPVPSRGGAAETSKGAQALKERLSPVKIVSPTLPKPVCPRCGAPIEDLPAAITDKESGEPIHFDCVLARLTESEPLADGEKVVYLGGGRFGIVHFDNPADLKRFKIRKTLQWEEKDKRAEWRRGVTDLFSST